MKFSKFVKFFLSGSGKRIHFILLFTSIIFSAIIIYGIPLRINKYKVDLKTELIGNDENYYYDLDHDGYSELIMLKNPGGPFKHPIEPAIKIFSHNNHIIDQWNFSEGWLERATFFGDYNHDENSEIYTFTQNKDSLFLYVLDFRNHSKFLIKRAFIAKAEDLKLNPQKIWDLAPIKVVFMDCDNDGYDDIVVNVHSGLSILPRELVAFSIKKNEILSRTPDYGSALNSLHKIKLKSNNQDIIIADCGTPDNIHFNYPYQDNKAWLMVFNKKLKFYFHPVPFPHEKTSLLVAPIHSRKNDYIAALSQYDGTKFITPSLSLFNLKGDLLRKIKLDKTTDWNIINLNYNDSSFICLYGVKNNNSKILLFDKNLYKIKDIDIGYPLGDLVLKADLDNDLNNEFVFYEGSYLTILSSDLTDPVKINLPENAGPALFTVKRNGYNRPELAVSFKNKIFTYNYFYNPLFALRYFIFAMIFGFVYSIQFGTYRFYKIKNLHDAFNKLNYYNLTHGVILLSNSKRIISLNSRVQNILQTRKLIRKGYNINIISFERPEIYSYISTSISLDVPTSKRFNIKNENFNFDGIIKCEPIFDNFNMLIGYYLEFIVNTKPLDSPKLKIWTKTVQQMVHDIKTPLSAIQLNIQTLQYKLRDSEFDEYLNYEKDFRLINREMNRVREMTKNLFAIHKFRTT